MASSVFYKFKSQKEESKVSFDGTGISVFEIKKEIILANNLGKSSDFDLVVFDGSSGEGLSHPRHTHLLCSYPRIFASLQSLGTTRI
jgi:protein MPE1